MDTGVKTDIHIFIIRESAKLHVGSEEVLGLADARHRTTVNSKQNLKSFIKHSIYWLRAIKRIHICYNDYLNTCL